MDEKNQLKQAYGAAIIFSLVVGFSFLAVKTCVPLASTLQILVWRYNWAALLMGVLIAIGIVKIRLAGKPKKNLMLTAGSYIGFMIFQTIGLIFATSIESGIIFAIIPILSKLIAGVVLKEKTGWVQNISMVLSISALMVMILMGSTGIQTNIIGLVVLIISSISMAISNVYMRYVRQVYRPVEITAAICFMGVFAFNLGYLVSGEAVHYLEPLRYTEFVVSTLYLGTACIVLSAQLMAFMLRYMPAVNATIFGNLSTAISIVAGVVILKEPLMLYHILCTVLIILGVLGVSKPDIIGNFLKERKTVKES
jgi:drug/metabolite transporter (DMT)-like permease